MIYLGVDPGKSGAIVAIDDDSQIIGKIKAAETLRDIRYFLEVCNPNNERIRAIIERVHSSPQMGVRSAFTFGQSFGQLEALIASHAIPYKLVTPAKWQGKMRCRTKGDKNVSKTRAQQLWPDVKITHAYADAALLAELCRTRWDDV